MDRFRMIATVVLVALIAAVGWGQDEAPAGAKDKPAQTATPATDEGALSADESAQLQQLSGGTKRYETWSEFVTDWMTPRPFDKKYVLRIDEKYAYPHIVASIKMEIIREDDQYIWLRGISPENPNSPLYKLWAKREADEAVSLAWKEIAQTPGGLNYLDFEAEAVPPPFQDSLDFEPVRLRGRALATE